MSIKQAKRLRLSKLFGTSLVEPAYNTTASAKKMLDTEMEYISYLRNRKKFFFMTQIQQTRVTVAKKKLEEKKKKKRKGGGFPWLRRLRRRLNPNKNKNKYWKGKGKGNPLGRFFRNARAFGLNKGRQLKYSRLGKLVRGGVTKIRAGGKFLGELPGKTATKIRKGIWDTGSSAFKKIKLYAQDKGILPKKGKVTQGGNFFTRNWSKIFKNKNVTQGGVKPNLFTKGRNFLKGKKLNPKGVPVLGALLSFWDWKDRKDSGQTNVQATSGVASGWITSLMTTAAFATAFPEPASSVAGILTLAILGSLGYSLGSGVSDEITGVNKDNKEGLADGGLVSSPTQALIAEGGEPELVIPNSKLGAVYQNLLKKVGSLITGVTAGFLQSLPVPSDASLAVMSEVSRIENLLGIKSERPSAFNGSKLTKVISSFSKRATNLMGSMPGPMGMISALGRVMFDTPAVGGPSINNSLNIVSTDSKSRVETLGTTSSTQVSGYPITDYYGPSSWRPRPHLGVDVGTPVGTGVAFSEPGEILAAGKYGGYGNLMDVWLPSQKIQMRIAHLSRFVKKSGEFSAGEVLAKTGGAQGDPGAGSSTGPHLHFEYSNEKNSINYGGSGNPLPYAHLIQLGNSKRSTVEAGGPSLETGFSPSYGHPLSSTVKWPSSGGSMGGPSSGFSNSKAKGMPLQPTPRGGTSITKKVSVIPIPMSVPVPIQVPVPMMKTTKERRVHGINAFSGRFGEL